jgi:hypothetical protein
MGDAPADGLGAIAYADPLVRVAEVAAHGAAGQLVAGGDLGAVVAATHLPQQLALAPIQLLGADRPLARGADVMQAITAMAV